MKFVVNRCDGWFGLSERARLECAKRGVIYDFSHSAEVDRSNPVLVEVVEELGKDANDVYADLEVVDIPDNAHWVLENHDGVEVVLWSMRPIHAV